MIETIIQKLFRLFIIIVTIYFYSCRNNNSLEKTNINNLDNTAYHSLPVEFIIISKNDFGLESISNGIIHATPKSDLHFITSGKIATILVKNGDTVQQGQKLAMLNNEQELNEYKIAIETKKTSETEFYSLLLGYNGGNNIDTTLLDKELLQNLKSQSGLNTAILQVKQAELWLNATYLYAPFSGVIADLNVHSSDYITQSETFCILLNNSAYDITFKLVESDLQTIQNASKISVATFLHPDLWYNGKVKTINPLIDENGMFTVTASIISSNLSRLRDGMNAKILIEEVIPDQIVIPKSAVVLRSNKEVVFTVKNGKSVWNYVTISDQNSNSYTISNG